MIAENEGSKVVQVERADRSVHVGPSLVPMEQIGIVEATCGRELEWRWAGLHKPVVARLDGQAVAVIMPILPTVPSGTA
jgi:hypothetical protein